METRKKYRKICCNASNMYYIKFGRVLNYMNDSVLRISIFSMNPETHFDGIGSSRQSDDLQAGFGQSHSYTCPYAGTRPGDYRHFAVPFIHNARIRVAQRNWDECELHDRPDGI